METFHRVSDGISMNISVRKSIPNDELTLNKHQVTVTLHQCNITRVLYCVYIAEWEIVILTQRYYYLVFAGQ